MDLSLLLVFIITFLAVYVFWSKPRNLPPGPFALPFIGSIAVMQQLKTTSQHLVLYEYAKKYGNIMSVRIGYQLIVVLSGFETIHEALVKKAEVFSDRPISMTIVQKVRQYGEGILTTDYNPTWRALRKFALHTLRDFGVGKSSLEEKIAVEVECVGTYLRQSDGQPIVMRDLLQKLISNVMYGMIVFGSRKDFDDPKFDEVRAMTNAMVQGTGPSSANNFLPAFLVWLFNKKDLEETEAILKNVELMRDYVYERIDEHEATYDENNLRDFIDFYIRSARKGDADDKDVLTKGNVFRLITDLFLAGSETTSSTLDWIFLYMAEYPDVQTKCQQEIEQVVGDKYIQYSDRGSLVYFEATMMEIQRMSMIVPLSVPHYVNTDTELGGYHIPANTLVIPSLYSSGMDEKIWPEPSKFKPGRFIDASGKLKKSEELIPFSVGPRTCLGEPLARLELFIVAAKLLQRFRFEREAPDIHHSFQSVPRQITSFPLPYKLRVFKR